MSDSTKYTSKLVSARILVIGGSSGIGYAVAEACLEQGAHVAISSSNASRVDAAVSKLQSSYPSKKDQVHGLTVDLGNAETLERELEGVLSGAVDRIGGGKGAEGKLDHVIFTAGDALPVIELKDMTMKNVVQAGQVRFFAPLLLAKFLPRYLENSYKSSYTITTGLVSEKPMPNWSVIASYAGGHHSMVRSLALDLRPIRSLTPAPQQVNGISPGVVETPLWRMSDEERAKAMETYGKKMATGRAGQPEDVAESYLGIVRDWNCTASMVRTDGGGMIMTG